MSLYLDAIFSELNCSTDPLVNDLHDYFYISGVAYANYWETLGMLHPGYIFFNNQQFYDVG